MPVDGRIRAYYWSIRAFLAEKTAILNLEHPDYRFPEDNDLRYFYSYFDPSGVRRFQYDNSPHHPHLSTFPHHTHKGPVPKKGKDIALDCDLAEVGFVAVVSKIEELLAR